jgi:hypothetical protein
MITFEAYYYLKEIKAFDRKGRAYSSSILPTGFMSRVKLHNK